MLLDVADVDDDVAVVAAVDETADDNCDEELFLGNFGLLMLVNGLKIESTYRNERDIHNYGESFSDWFQ